MNNQIYKDTFSHVGKPTRVSREDKDRITWNKVSKEDKENWGSYSDRSNSFDDTSDIDDFISLVNKHPELKSYIRSFLPENTNLIWKPKPLGNYNVDIGIVNSTHELVATFDVERWREWNPDWPTYYKHIHFLGRKNKFLLQNELPFFMCFLNYTKNKVLVVDRDTIENYPTIEKKFKRKAVRDTVRELPLSSGKLFGESFSVLETDLFREGCILAL